jgi:2-hydroxy-3-oxopropionate reductase
VTRIAFIGLGVMGRPMADNLEAAGHEVIRVRREDSAAAAAARAEAVITMLPDSPDVRGAIEGEDGVFAAAAAGTLLIEMSTISPRVATELAAAARERGLAMVDAPVSGGDVGAREGTLSIMVGGEAADVERARPLLEVLGSRITHCGGPGSGQVVKACNQVAVALEIEAVAEALVLGEAAGVEAETILDALGGGLAASRVMEARRENFLSRTYPPGFRAELHRKDLGIALETAREHGVALPATPVVERLLGILAEAGRGGEDHTALLAAVEALRDQV